MEPKEIQLIASLFSHLPFERFCRMMTTDLDEARRIIKPGAQPIIATDSQGWTCCRNTSLPARQGPTSASIRHAG